MMGIADFGRYPAIFHYRVSVSKSDIWYVQIRYPAEFSSMCGDASLFCSVDCQVNFQDDRIWPWKEEK
jgi:hypothetical protein